MRPQIIHKAEDLATLLDANAPRNQVDLCAISSTLLDPAIWMSDPRNIALKQGYDLAMFEHMGPGTYLGHIFFASRGRHALDVARDMLSEMFNRYDAILIRGEIPVKRRDVQLFMRLLGFKQTHMAIRPKGAVIVASLTLDRLPLKGNTHAISSEVQEAIPLAE